MGRRYGIAVVMVWGWCCGLVVAPQVVAAGKPNIVHIMIDDLGWQDVACYYRAQHGEEPFYETPHLDRLAQRGIRFMRAYSPAVTCAPSRAAFISAADGKPPSATSFAASSSISASTTSSFNARSDSRRRPAASGCPSHASLTTNSEVNNS